MSTTFSIDGGSEVQAQAKAKEEDSIVFSRNATLKGGRVRHTLPDRGKGNPNTPTASRRRVKAPVATDDTQTAARCREALHWITTLPEGSVRVSVSTGCVRLEGVVRHQNERDVAEDTIRKLDGVADVENLLDVR